ncbi:MAG: hypothetical protein A2X56_12400 [Nitrospirae bacterium GWC2_57_13]|nr:MAG: hypothetical protein A2X56_12400 [Nitrospirae bacterium GWC2_57_13]HAS55241.1 hypothetical protein [Nitrospiraceae bacterium]
MLVLFIAAAGCQGHRAGDGPLLSTAAERVRYQRQTEGTQAIPHLREAVVDASLSGKPAHVAIIVHPAYALFFPEDNAREYSGGRARLVRNQLRNEAKFLENNAGSDNAVMILVLPAGSITGQDAAAGYGAYLNRQINGAGRVFYVYSESTTNGALAQEDMLLLYQYLNSVRSEKVMIGGGFVGRCQESFFKQLATYVKPESIFIIPEISSISPADVSDSEARRIATLMDRHDFEPVRTFVRKKTDGSPNVLSFSRSDVPAESNPVLQ